MKKYTIKKNDGTIIQEIYANSKPEAHPAWGKPQRTVYKESEAYTHADIIDEVITTDMLGNKTTQVVLRSEFVIEEKDARFELLFNEFKSIRSKILSPETDYLETAPFLATDCTVKNREIKECLRLCRLYINNENELKAIDISNGFPKWCEELEIKYHPLYTDKREDFIKNQSVVVDYTLPINKPKNTAFWTEFKLKWKEAKNG